MSKINDLLHKLKALAEKGIGGEKENAAAKLEQLMTKHGITLDQLESDEVKHQFIKHKDTFDSRVITQCVIKVLGSVQIYEARHVDGYDVTMWESTDAQYLEIKALTEFYRPLWADEVDFFFRAFVQKHVLLPPNPGVDKVDSKTSEKIQKMTRGMDDREYHKQLQK